MKHLFFLCIALFVFAGTQAQKGQSNAELAYQYYSTGDYEKAAVYFEKYYNDDAFNAYAPYLKCLLALNDADKAEKLIRRQLKKFPADITAKVDLGSIYELQGDKDKAQKHFNELIKELEPDVNRVNMLGNAFINRQHYEKALQTYLQGRKILKGTYPFNFELAEMYAHLGRTQEMIDEYLDMINFHSGYLANVQTILQNKMANETTGNFADLVRTSLLRRIQKNPDEAKCCIGFSCRKKIMNRLSFRHAESTRD
jgi:tetratricopeptide (TPR) repeat protein